MTTATQQTRQRIIRKGAEHPRSRLTAEDVIEMRHLYDNQDVERPVYMHTLARRFGVSTSQVQRIIARRLWKCLP